MDTHKPCLGNSFVLAHKWPQQVQRTMSLDTLTDLCLQKSILRMYQGL